MTRLLIVVDFQNDFISGALGFEGAEELVVRIAAKIGAYRAAGDQIAFTFDRHDAQAYANTQEGRNLPILHCVEGTDGYRLHPDIEALVQPEDLIFPKPTFGSIDLAKWLDAQNAAAAAEGRLPFESIEVVGLVSNICVVSNVVLAKAACPEVPVIVDAACTGSGDLAAQEAAFTTMESIQVRVLR